MTFQTGPCAVNRERRSFALVRPVADTNAQDVVRALILSADTEYEQATWPPSVAPGHMRGLRRFQRSTFPHD